MNKLLILFLTFAKLLCMCLLTNVLVGCGVTKATISKPAEGTQTTITITTNNPISTNVNPNVEIAK